MQDLLSCPKTESESCRTSCPVLRAVNPDFFLGSWELHSPCTVGNTTVHCTVLGTARCCLLTVHCSPNNIKCSLITALVLYCTVLGSILQCVLRRQPQYSTIAVLVLIVSVADPSLTLSGGEGQYSVKGDSQETTGGIGQ